MINTEKEKMSLQEAITILKAVPFTIRPAAYVGHTEKEIKQIKEALLVLEQVPENEELKRFLYLCEEPVTYHKVGWAEITYHESTDGCRKRLAKEKVILADKLLKIYS